MDTIAYLREWANGHFDLISTYKSEIHRLILEISVIDSFSQIHEKHNNNNQKEFVDFLVTYGGKYSEILKSVCPIILYYNEFLETEELHISRGRIYNSDDDELMNEAFRLMNLLVDTKKEKAYTKYSYAGLIYQMRNKMSHELRLINMPAHFHEPSDFSLPYVAGENYIKNGKLLFGKWALNIPETFIIAVGKEVINNFLDECEQNSIDLDLSAENCYLKWYD